MRIGDEEIRRRVFQPHLRLHVVNYASKNHSFLGGIKSFSNKFSLKKNPAVSLFNPENIEEQNFELYWSANMN